MKRGKKIVLAIALPFYIVAIITGAHLLSLFLVDALGWREEGAQFLAVMLAPIIGIGIPFIIFSSD